MRRFTKDMILILGALLASCGSGSGPGQDIISDIMDATSQDLVAPPLDEGQDLTVLDLSQDSVAPSLPCSDDHDELEGCVGSIECNSEKLAFLSNSCVDCLYQGIVSCGLKHCPSLYSSSCHADCVMEDNPKLCILENCSDDPGLSCVLDAHLAGLCAEDLGGCGLLPTDLECAECTDQQRTCIRAPDQITCGPCAPGSVALDDACVTPTQCPESACGPNGSCAVGSSGPACLCDAGYANTQSFDCAAAFTTNEWVEILGVEQEVVFWQGTNDTPTGSEPNASVPCHPVTLSQGYAMMKYEVTVQEYAICVQAGACPKIEKCNLGEPHDPHDPRLSDHPVLCASFNTAKAYCTWVGGALPSESQWEYAASSALECAPLIFYPWGEVAITGDRANYLGSTNPFQSPEFPFTQNGGPTSPVGFFDGSLRERGPDGWLGDPETFQTQDNSSPFGIYDMAGNVAEWTLDCWNPDYTSKTINDGSPWIDESSDCTKRVKKGEAWSDVPDALTTHFRAPKSPFETTNFLGIRCVRALELVP